MNPDSLGLVVWGIIDDAKGRKTELKDRRTQQWWRQLELGLADLQYLARKEQVMIDFTRRGTDHSLTIYASGEVGGETDPEVVDPELAEDEENDELSFLAEVVEDWALYDVNVWPEEEQEPTKE